MPKYHKSYHNEVHSHAIDILQPLLNEGCRSWRTFPPYIRHILETAASQIVYTGLPVDGSQTGTGSK